MRSNETPKPDVNLTAPRSNIELRAHKTTGIRGDRDAPAADPQSASYVRLIAGKRGVKSGAALPYLMMEVS